MRAGIALGALLITTAVASPQGYEFEGVWALDFDQQCDAPIIIGPDGIERGAYHCQLMISGRAGEVYVGLQRCESEDGERLQISTEILIIDQNHILLTEDNGAEVELLRRCGD